ncbi:MAG: hypothetical protein IT306_31290 [Chloroflexi bacterium]|nr:hypothetical protein [Chloroflexota bacterium]
MVTDVAAPVVAVPVSLETGDHLTRGLRRVRERARNLPTLVPLRWDTFPAILLRGTLEPRAVGHGPDSTSGSAGRIIVSIGPTSPFLAAGRDGRPHVDQASPARPTSFRRLVGRLGATALVLTLAISTLTATPALGAGSGASGAADEAGAPRQIVMPRLAVQDEPRDAFDGGFTPAARRVVVPNIELGLTQQRPIPLGVTCSCTIDRTGLTSQFDLTVIEVVQDASTMVQQLNRFNRPPRAGARYVGVYVGQQYIAGPENQAYTISEADWKATATDERLSDTAQLLHTELEFRPRADIFPKNYVNGWLIFELPVNRPAFLVWNYNFVGERGIWFALQ